MISLFPCYSRRRSSNVLYAHAEGYFNLSDRGTVRNPSNIDLWAQDHTYANLGLLDIPDGQVRSDKYAQLVLLYVP